MLIKENPDSTEIVTNCSTAFMTSPIGDLTLDSDGLRKAVDEIARCHNIIKQRDERIKQLEDKVTELLGELNLPF